METLEFILFLILIIGGIVAFLYYSPYLIGVLALVGAIQLFLFFYRPVQFKTSPAR